MTPQGRIAIRPRRSYSNPSLRSFRLTDRCTPITTWLSTSVSGKSSTSINRAVIDTFSGLGLGSLDG